MSFSKNIFDDDVGEIDTRCWFHQHFTSSFWANIFLPKNFKAKLRLEKSWPKFAHKTMMKLTPSVNLINILQAAFALKFCCQKITKPNCKLHKAENMLIRCSYNWLLAGNWTSELYHLWHALTNWSIVKRHMLAYGLRRLWLWELSDL